MRPFSVNSLVGHATYRLPRLPLCFAVTDVKHADTFSPSHLLFTLFTFDSSFTRGCSSLTRHSVAFLHFTLYARNPRRLHYRLYLLGPVTFLTLQRYHTCGTITTPPAPATAHCHTRIAATLPSLPSPPLFVGSPPRVALMAHMPFTATLLLLHGFG